MLDQITLIITTQTQNKHGEKIDNKTEYTIAATRVNVSRSSRDTYNREGVGRALRFKFNLYGPSFFENITNFIHDGIEYSVTDLTQDKTGTSFYIEGVDNR